jgi:hypothetical protein
MGGESGYTIVVEPKQIYSRSRKFDPARGPDIAPSCASSPPFLFSFLLAPLLSPLPQAGHRPGNGLETTMASLSTLGGFTAGALAACGAVTVTNPMEVVKTRLQLQGELAAKGQVKRVYTGVFQALRIIAAKEGIRGKPPTPPPHARSPKITG